MTCAYAIGTVHCPNPKHGQYAYCITHIQSLMNTGIPLTQLIAPLPAGGTVDPFAIWATTATDMTVAPTAPAPEKKKNPPTVDAESVAKVICQLDMSKEKKAELASEFAEGLVELKTKFNRDNFVNYIKEYSK